jgi:hypothetical protein
MAGLVGGSDRRDPRCVSGCPEPLCRDGRQPRRRDVLLQGGKVLLKHTVDRIHPFALKLFRVTFTLPLLVLTFLAAGQPLVPDVSRTRCVSWSVPSSRSRWPTRCPRPWWSSSPSSFSGSGSSGTTTRGCAGQREPLADEHARAAPEPDGRPSDRRDRRGPAGDCSAFPVPPFSVLFLRERFSRRKALAAVLTLAEVLLVTLGCERARSHA